MERWLSKLLAIIVMTVFMLLVTLLPFKLVATFKRWGKRGEMLMLTLGCFTGGIFLGTCLMFLIPEVASLMRNAVEEPTGISYPFGEVIIGFGFFFIMFVERTIHSCQNSEPEQPEKKKPVPSEPVENGNHVTNGNGVTQSRYGNYLDENGLGHELSSFVPNSTVDVRRCSRIEISISSTLDLAKLEGDATKTVILFFALSLDEFLGGISLGLQRTNSAVWSILIGLLAHESVVGFGLGLQLSSLPQSRRFFAITLAVGYAIFGTIGAIVGTVIAETTEASQGIDLVNGILQGIATGVFIYVTFFEILEGKVHRKTRVLDLVAIAVGFFIMAAIAAIPSGEISEPEHLSANISSTNFTSVTGNFTWN